MAALFYTEALSSLLDFISSFPNHCGRISVDVSYRSYSEVFSFLSFLFHSFPTLGFPISQLSDYATIREILSWQRRILATTFSNCLLFLNLFLIGM